MCYLFFCNLPNKFSFEVMVDWVKNSNLLMYLKLLKFELKLSKSWIDILSGG